MIGKYWAEILIGGGTKTCGTTVLSQLIQGNQ